MCLEFEERCNVSFQEYLDLGLPQLDTPPSSQESSEADDDEGEEKFPYLL